jgi:hypothetical protein
MKLLSDSSHDFRIKKWLFKSADNRFSPRHSTQQPTTPPIEPGTNKSFKKLQRPKSLLNFLKVVLTQQSLRKKCHKAFSRSFFIAPAANRHFLNWKARLFVGMFWRRDKLKRKQFSLDCSHLRDCFHTESNQQWRIYGLLVECGER